MLQYCKENGVLRQFLAGETAALSAALSRWLIRLSVLWWIAIGAGAYGADAPQRLEATGLVMPFRKVDLAANSEGVIKEILVREGGAVTGGQVLARLDAAREKIEVEYTKLVMEKRESDGASAKDLFQQKILSKNQWEEKGIDAKVAETQYRLAQQALEAKEIKAPFAGLVVRLHKEQGESIRNLEPFAELVSLERVYVALYLEAPNLQRIKLGQHAEVNIPACGEQRFTGVVEIVDPVVDPASGLFRVKVAVENPDGRIRTGTKATVVLTE